MTPNYTKALKKSIEVLKQYGIGSAPIDIFKIVNQIPNLKTCTYSEFAEKQNCTVDEIINLFESDLGAIVRDKCKNNYAIYYNDTKYNSALDRFTISHELGHYFLNHYKKITKDILDRGGFGEKEYSVLEKEANCFARNLLSPVPLYNRIVPDIITQKWRVMETFNISYEAMKARIDFLGLDNLRIRKDDIEYFNAYEMPCFDYCGECGNSITKKVDYCPICGSNKILTVWDPCPNNDDIWELGTIEDIINFEGSKKMFYRGVEVDENSKVLKCPVCGNEEVEEGDYCKICKTYLVNKCTNDVYPGRSAYDGEICAELLDGNARYCPYCGSESTFFRDKLLKAWQECTDNDESVEDVLQPVDDDIFQPVDDNIFQPIEDIDIPF